MTIPIHAIIFITFSLIWFIFFVPKSEGGGYGPDLVPIARVTVWIIIFLIYAGIYIW